MDNSTSRLPTSNAYSIHKSYKFQEILGKGSFGTVIKCVRQETDHTVAIKITSNNDDVCREANMLKILMSHNLDKCNIIKFYGEFIMGSRISLMLEVLDISLMDYLIDVQCPLPPGDIRSIMEQLATALDALKKIGVIHTDVKPDNIMLVDHVRQPFRVKLIDFGMAIFRSEAMKVRVRQVSFYRAPEIMLGLPFSEAIDIWSLGCVMADMLFGYMLFPAIDDYNILRYITELLGPVPDHLLNDGQRSQKFFKKNDSDHWMIKTRKEFWGREVASMENRCYNFRSLEKEKKMSIKTFLKGGAKMAKERRKCVELLMEMLNLDGNQRIPPSGILNHPFITKSYLNSSSHQCYKPLESPAAEPSSSQTQIETKQTEAETIDEDRPHPAAAPSTTMDSSGLCSDKMDFSTTRPDENENKKKKKKRRNVFTCFFSWMRKKIFSS